MKLKYLLYAATFLLVAVLACQKEISGTIDPPTPEVITTVSATVVGRIVDENGAPVQGALVKTGVSSAQTNINGEFRMNKAALSDKRAFITVEKNGYFTGSRTFIAKANQKHYIEIQLLPKTNAGNIDAAAGGTITLSNTSVITLPANGVVVKSTGAVYTGNVQVAMTWIDPTSPNLSRQMPGDLRGINEAGAEVGMQSFGMLGVELTGAGGESLQIASGKKATLKFPLPSALSSAPPSIPLWSFNDSMALWKQEGTATKNGNFYVAEVSHFSFWNCDAQFPVVNFTARFVDQTNQPLQHMQVRIKRSTPYGMNYTYGFTDSVGTVSGLVPKNENLVLEVYPTSTCAQAIYTQSIGPFSEATNIGTVGVTLTAASMFTVTGNVVNCTNTPVTSGYIYLSTGTTAYRTTLVNGAFTLSFSGCSATQSITYYAVDSSNSQQSTTATATLTTATTALGTISACGVSTQRYINFTLDGTAYSITSPPDSTASYSFQNNTYLHGFKSGGNTAMTNINTGFTGTNTGTFPLNSLSIRTSSFSDSTSIPAAGINVTVTEYGAAGSGFISGNFSGTLNGNNGATHTIQCNFRVRRD